jgi:hypothetical protein
MPSITTELAGILSKVHRHGDFFTFGTTEILVPRLEVAGVGLVALPLLAAQAEQLIAVAEQAPHGRGADTLVDINVRRTWQIHADQVQMGGKHWPRTLDAILARVAEGLGVSQPIATEFYKLLIYDEGSFFVSHRDSEKTGGMFATLVVVLPSISTGGELIVRHQGREVSLHMRCEEPCEAAFAAFYADCVHEVRPVTSGFRLTLVYNLLRKGKGRRPEPPGYDSERDRAATLLKKWAAGKRSADDKTPEKLIYPLDHAYTPAELGSLRLNWGSRRSRAPMPPKRTCSPPPLRKRGATCIWRCCRSRKAALPNMLRTSTRGAADGRTRTNSRPVRSATGTSICLNGADRTAWRQR